MKMDRLLLKSGIVLDPARGEIFEGDVLIEGEVISRVAGSGDIDDSEFAPKQVIDVWGRYVAPGLVDAHLHIESSMLTPTEFAKAALVHGTTAMFVDPHEIANVRKDGIELFLKVAEKLPLDMYVGIPSCVPATHLEDAGAEVKLEDIKALIDHPRVYGLAEMMNFPGVIHGFGDARAKVDLVYAKGKIVDGHAPGLSGEALVSYITNGRNDGVIRIMSDHESTGYEEALEKSEAGMYVALRYGSASKDLEKILPAIIKNKDSLHRYMLCSDDLEAEELTRSGHMDRTLRRVRQIVMENSNLAIDLATLVALKLASHNPGKYFERFFTAVAEPGMGEIAEGKRANLIVLNDLENLLVNEVVVRGKLAARAGKLLTPVPDYNYLSFTKTVKLDRTFKFVDFTIPCAAPSAKVNVIGAIPGSVLTKKLELEMKTSGGELKADPARDIAKIAVIERHKATGKFALGFVQGLGIQKPGAVASTVAHDSHNLIVVGTDDQMMAEAVNKLANTGGGMVALAQGREAYHPLEICGLMSMRSVIEIGETFEAIKNVAKALGTRMDNVFMTLSFLALPVIPELKITNRGIVDVAAFNFIPLIQG
jgi:adenine deaminase